MLLAGAGVTAPALDLLMTGGPALAAAQNGDHVSPTLVDSVETTVRQVRALDDTEGAASALAWAGGIWQNIGRVLTDSRYSGRTAARLQTAYIEMCETYGWMLFDTSHHAQAQRVYQTGLRLAHEAHDDIRVHRATINLLASAAYQATWLDQRHEAATMLHVAVKRTPNALTPRLNAVLGDRQIALAGRTGDHELIRRLEDEAHQHLAATTNRKDPWWTEWISDEMIDTQTGRAWLAAGDPDAAEPYLRLSTTDLDTTYPREFMLRSTELAHAREQLGDIPGAADAASAARAIGASIGSSRIHEHLDLVTRTLARVHYHHPAVQKLLAQYPDPA